MSKPRIRVALAFLATVLAAAFFGPRAVAPASAQERVAEVPVPQPPADGSFALVDHTGRTVTDGDFRGGFMLVYFGYTYCPDVCPTGLQVMSEAVDLLGAAGARVQPIFITVDPERDTAAVMADYVPFFHPRMIGLTGTPARIAEVAKRFGVRYFKLFFPIFDDDEEEDDGDDGDDVDYLLNHSASTYLMGPDGRGLAVFPHGAGAEDMAREIRRFIDGEP